MKKIVCFIALSIGCLMAAVQNETTENQLSNSPTLQLSVNLANTTPPQSIYATIHDEFSRVITLGYRCQTKGAVNQYFNRNSPITQTKSGHADLFDWLFISNYSLLADALLKNLEDFFEWDDFQWDVEHGIDHHNKRYNMNWNHLTSNHASISKKPSNLDELKVLFDTVIKDKINHLKQKFIDAKNFTTLYVISFQGKTNINQETAKKLRNGLTHIRNGNQQFSLLIITQEQTFESFENVYIRQATPLGVNWNQFNPMRWKEILDEFHFSKNIWD